MSHLQETIHKYDISSQIIYNRALTQLGLCAFRIGLLEVSHSCLSEIFSNQKPKELLAQGITTVRYQDINKEIEKEMQEERNRLVPYHMHINLDMLEGCYLLGVMILEVPNLF